MVEAYCGDCIVDHDPEECAENPRYDENGI